MGESVDDRLRLLEVLSSFDPAPESVPINCLMAMPGTPLADQPPVDVFELVRLIATTRIALPRAKVRLSAGRTRLSREAQALCFFAGANSIFYGDKLLTAENPGVDADQALLEELNLRAQPAFAGRRRSRGVDAAKLSAGGAMMVAGGEATGRGRRIRCPGGAMADAGRETIVVLRGSRLRVGSVALTTGESRASALDELG